jgi:hypothetical protein
MLCSELAVDGLNYRGEICSVEVLIDEIRGLFGLTGITTALCEFSLPVFLNSEGLESSEGFERR